MKRIIFCLLVVAITTTCKKQGPPGPEGLAGPKGETGATGSTPTGTISGKIKQYDAFGGLLVNNLNTTTVSVSGTSISAITDSEGSFSLTNVPSGYHELLVKKPSSGLSRIQQVAFPGNGNLYVSGNLCDRAPYEFTGGSLKDTTINNGHCIKAKVTYNLFAGQRTMLLLFSKNPTIDPDDPKTFRYSSVYNSQVNSTSSTIYFIYTQALANFYQSFSVGQTVYCNIYPCSNFTGRYIDKVENKFVYPGAGNALGPVFSFTVQ